MAQFLFCGAETFADASDADANPLTIIGKTVVFQLCGEVPGWASFALFMLVSLPLMLIVAVLVSQVTAAGGVVTLIAGGLAAIIGFFS